MVSLIQTIYGSDSAATFQEHEIPDLLKEIRPKNARAHVTGMLIFTGKSFLQLLEGPAAEVDATFARIMFDTRHTSVTRIARQPIAQRQLPDWTMDFVTLHAADVAQITGLDAFHEYASCTRLDVGAARKLVSALQRPSWHHAVRQPFAARRTA